MSRTRIVIGGGISGLLAAIRHADSGEEVSLVSPEFGGQIASVKIAGLSVDAGAEAISTANPAGEQLLHELGLGEMFAYPQPSGSSIISSEKRWKIPFGYFGIPADLSTPTLLDAFSQQELALAQQLDSKNFNPSGSVAKVVTDHLGAAFLERLVDPIVRSIHGSPSNELDFAATFPDLAEKAIRAGSLVAGVQNMSRASNSPGLNVISLRGGLHQMIDALVHRVSDKVKLKRSQVSSIKAAGNGWDVGFADSSKFFDSVTWAAPALILAKAAGIDSEIGRAALMVDQKSTSIAFAHVNAPGLDAAPLGSGAIVRDGTALAQATTHLSAKWEWIADSLPLGQHLIRLSFGENQLPESGDGLDALLKSEIEFLYGTEVDLLRAKVVSWTQALARSKPEQIAPLLQAIDSSASSFELVSGFARGNGVMGIITDHIQRKAA